MKILLKMWYSEVPGEVQGSRTRFYQGKERRMRCCIASSDGRLLATTLGRGGGKWVYGFLSVFQSYVHVRGFSYCVPASSTGHVLLCRLWDGRVLPHFWEPTHCCSPAEGERKPRGTEGCIGEGPLFAPHLPTLTGARYIYLATGATRE